MTLSHAEGSGSTARIVTGAPLQVRRRPKKVRAQGIEVR